MSANALVDANGSATLVSDGPIIGFDEPGLTIPAADYLTTGELTTSAGDAGDAGTLANFSIEFWVRTPTTGTQQVLAQGPTAHPAVPNRQWKIYLASTGKIKFDFVDSSNVNHSLTGGTALVTGQWYHVVAVKDTTTQRIYLNGTQDNSQLATGAPWGDLSSPGADLRIGDSGNTYNIDYAEFAFYRYNLAAGRVSAHYQAGAQRGFPNQLTYARIISVMDQSASTAPLRGDTVSVSALTPRYMSGQSPLDLMQEAARSDVAGVASNPMLFIGADGAITYHSGSHRGSPPYNTIQTTFGDQASEVPYIDVVLDYSDSYLANEVNVTREGTARVAGQTQTSSDATSIARYLRRTRDISGVPLSLDSLAQNMADGLLAKYKDPIQRVVSLTLFGSDPNIYFAAFQREIADKIRVLRTPPGGGSRIQQDVWIQKIEISASNDGNPPKIRFAVSPL